MPCCNTATYNRLQRILCRPCKLYHTRCKTARRALQWRILRFAPFYQRIYQTDIIDYNDTCATLERITALVRHTPIPDTTFTPERCTGQRSIPIIIKYIRAQGCAPVMAPCQTVQHIADHASPAGSSPTVCGSLASAAPCAPAEVSASPPVQD